MAEALFGVLLDVSGSMQSAYALDRTTDASVERTHALLTTIINIVKQEAVRHFRQESIFACAFGLNNRSVKTCDLIPVLRLALVDGHRALIDLAESYGAPHAKRWIKDHLSQDEAKYLYLGVCEDTSSAQKLVDLLPSRLTTEGASALKVGAGVVSVLFRSSKLESRMKEREKKQVHNSEVYGFADICRAPAGALQISRGFTNVGLPTQYPFLSTYFHTVFIICT